VIAQGLDVARKLDDPGLRAKMLGILGDAALAEGDADKAVTLYEQATSLHRIPANRFNLGVSLGWLSIALLEGSHPHEAEPSLREALEIFCGFRNDWEISFILDGFADLIADDDAETAVKLLAKADALREQTRGPLLGNAEDRIRQVTARTSAVLETSHWQQAWDQGHDLSLDDAVDLALSFEPGRAARKTSPRGA